MSDKTVGRPNVEQIHNYAKGGMGRRRLLRTLASVGFAGSTLQYLSIEDIKAASSDEVPIVYGFARTDPEDPGTLSPRKKMVPTDWYNDLQHAFRIHEIQDFIGQSGIKASWVSPGDYGGENASIEVDIDDEDVRGTIPESIEQVPVNVNYVKGFSKGNCNNGHAPDAVPGSMKISPGDGYGTLSSPVYDTSESQRLFATAGHIFDAGSEGVISDPVYQPDDSYLPIGLISDQFCSEDLVVAEPRNNHSPQYEIKGASPSAVVGHFSKSGLSDLKAQDEPLEKIGVKTCHTEGHIEAVDGDTNYYGCSKSGQLKWGSTSDFDDGDSGSVNYHPDPENPNDFIMIGGMNNARTWWGSDYVWGTAAHHISDKLGLDF
jgi:hypothetical protein